MVRVVHAVIRAHEGLRQRLEAPRRAVPRKLVGEKRDARAETGRVRFAHHGVHAVCTDDEIGALEFG